MFHFIKKQISKLWKNRKIFFLISFLSFLLFMARFPWNDLLEKSIKKAQKEMPSDVYIDFDKVQARFFPPGVKFKKLFLKYNERALSLNSLNISLDWLKWLSFKKAWKVKAYQGDSSLLLSFWTKKEIFEDFSSETPISFYFIQGSSPSLDLSLLNSVLSGTQLTGKVQARWSYQGPLELIERAKAHFYLKGQAIYLSRAELKTSLGPLNFPPIDWNSVEMDFRLKEGEIVFKTFRLGEARDRFIVQMKGTGAVSFAYGQPRLDSYDIELQMDLRKGFEIPLLDLMFSGFKEDRGSFYRYGLQMSGRGSQVPQMEKRTNIEF